jgi:hypothetical protein
MMEGRLKATDGNPFSPLPHGMKFNQNNSKNNDEKSSPQRLWITC